MITSSPPWPYLWPKLKEISKSKTGVVGFSLPWLFLELWTLQSTSRQSGVRGRSCRKVEGHHTSSQSVLSWGPRMVSSLSRISPPLPDAVTEVLFETSNWKISLVKGCSFMNYLIIFTRTLILLETKVCLVDNGLEISCHRWSWAMSQKTL